MTPLVSEATVIEYEAVLKRKDHLAASRLDAADIDVFLDAYVAHADHVAPHFGYRPSIPDPEDEIFVAVAVNGRADALAAFNVTNYARINHRSTGPTVPVHRPGDILKRLKWRPSATSPFAFRHR